MQHPGGGAPVQALLDHLERGRVDPVGVLDDHQDGLPGGEPEQLLGERLEGPRPLRLRRQIERAIACAAVEAEQVGDQGRAAVSDRPVEQGLQLVQPRLERIVRSQPRRIVQLLDHRPERAVGVVGRALVADAKVRLLGHGVEQGAADPRLADAGLADQQHALAFARLGQRPALEQQRQLLIAPDHRQERRATHRFEAALDRALAGDHDRPAPARRSP